MTTHDGAPLHAIRWTYSSRTGVTAEAVCLEPVDADCRLTGAGPECSCETWGRIERRDDGTIWHLIAELDSKSYIPQPDDWHQLKVMSDGDCNVCVFINESGMVEELTPEGEHVEFVLAETPFRPVWENDGCSWRPASAVGDARKRQAETPGLDVAGIRARAEACLNGFEAEVPASWYTQPDNVAAALRKEYGPGGIYDADAAFIVACSPAVAVALLAALDEAQAERDELMARLTGRERQHADRLAAEAAEGDTGICRTCARPITFTTVEEPGYNPRTGWSDGARRDALVCFKAVDYAHVPLVGRERGIWDAAVKAAGARAEAALAAVREAVEKIADVMDSEHDGHGPMDGYPECSGCVHADLRAALAGGQP